MFNMEAAAAAVQQAQLQQQQGMDMAQLQAAIMLQQQQLQAAQTQAAQVNPMLMQAQAMAGGPCGMGDAACGGLGAMQAQAPQMQMQMQMQTMPGACGMPGMPGGGGMPGGKGGKNPVGGGAKGGGERKYIPCIHFARGFCARGEACYYKHDIMAAAAAAPQMGGGDWDCPNCGDRNFARNEACRKCAYPRPAGYGPIMGGKGGKGKGPYNSGAPTFIPQMDKVTGATPEEVEAFLIATPVEEHAQTQFRQMDPKAQRMVINRGLMEATDLTAAFCGRMKSVNRIMTQGVQLAPGDWLCPGCLDTQFSRNASCRRCGITKENGAESISASLSMYGMTADMAGPATGGAGMPNLENVIPATPQEVEEFLILNPVEEHAQLQFRQMDPKGQRMVINRGKMEGARDPTAAFMGRLKSVKRTITGQVQCAPGDWICSSCGDLQFSRNQHCRRCGIAKPDNLPSPQVASAAAQQMQMPQQMATAEQMAALGMTLPTAMPTGIFAPIQDWGCTSCGAVNPAASNFCGQCGAKKV